MKRRRERRCGFSLLSVLFLLCLCLLVLRIGLFAANRQTYSVWREHSGADPAEDTDPGTGWTASAGELMGCLLRKGTGEDAGAEPIPSDVLRMDWDFLSDSGAAAWLHAGDISYPVMQGEDNSFYLNHLPDGRWNPGGSLFLQAENNPFFTDRHSIVYGHNMADGSMFGKLKQFKTKELDGVFLDLYLPDGTLHRYEIFSVLRVNSLSDAFTLDFADDQAFFLYQEEMKKLALAAGPAECNAEGRILTLATCDGMQGTDMRLLVQGMEKGAWNLKTKQERRETVKNDESEK